MRNPLSTLATAAIAGILIISLIASLCFMSYKYGRTKVEAEYSKNVAIVIEEALKKQGDLNRKLTGVSNEYNTSIANERRRAEGLQRQLRSKHDAVHCVEGPGGDSVAFISPGSLRLLVESTNYKSLPKAADRSCTVSETNTVSASDFIDYTICIIGDRNGVAGQLTGLIDSVKIYQDATQPDQ